MVSYRQRSKKISCEFLENLRVMWLSLTNKKKSSKFDKFIDFVTKHYCDKQRTYHTLYNVEKYDE